MKTAVLALAALIAASPAHADSGMSCPDAAKAIHDVIVGLPLLMDEIGDLHPKGRSQAEIQKWGNSAFHMARNGIGAVNYGLENCQGFGRFSEAQSVWKDTADNLRSLGFH
jgi:hypothetical protein